MKEAIESLCKDIEPYEPVEISQGHYEDMLTLYPLGDPHIGMLAWYKESGENFDLKIAERDLTQGILEAMSRAPRTKEAVLCNLGDFFHSDTSENKTRRNGNALDVDGRYDNIIWIGVRILRRAVDMLLTRHERVRLINVIGNHDDDSSKWLNLALTVAYENEPRIEVVPNHSKFTYIEYGKVLLGFSHGDGPKEADLIPIMACDMREAWGRTDTHIFHRGHFHHDRVIEVPGGKVETHETLATADLWHFSQGYRSKQSIKFITYDPQYGEWDRGTVPLKYIRDKAAV